MADFPVTVNGVTWNASDFAESKYSRNLFNFLKDVFTESCKSLNSYVTNSMTIGNNNVTMTLPSVKNYIVGQRLRLVPAVDETTSNFLAGYIEGYVVSYNTGTGDLVLHPLMWQGTGTYSRWHVTPGGEPIPVFPSITALQGGASSIRVEGPIETFTEFFEDFNGTEGNGIVTSTTGSGRVYFDGNVKAAESSEYASKALDGDHPGIVVLEVSEEGSTAEINLGSCSSNLNAGGVYRVMFLLDCSALNTFYMQIGLRVKDGTEFEPGAMIEYPRASGANAVCSVFEYATHESTLPLERGVWYEIRIYCLEGAEPNEIKAKLYRVNNYSVDLVYTFPQFTWFSPGANSAVMPFVKLKKLYRNRNLDRLWVDYLHFKPTISRSLIESDFYFSFVTFLCNFTGVNGSTTFIDVTGKTITAYGNAQIGTSGGQHGLFDGNSDYLIVPDNDDWTMSGEFTVEISVSLNQADNQAFLGQWDSLDAWYLYVVSGQLFMRMKSNSGVTTDLGYAWTPTLGQKYHIAVDRDASNKLRLYIDGVMVASMTYAATMNASLQPLVIGAIGQYNTFPTFDLNGKVHGIRLTNTVSRFATDTTFTVPSLPFLEN